MTTVKVRLDDGEQAVTASITQDAVQDPVLEVGTAAVVLVKSTEVMIGVE
ncbi:MAG: TOBE domain-containing protein [Nakamurella sp.]